MNDLNQSLAKPPIVEAVIDIDVEMRPGFVLSQAKEALATAFADQYPVVREREFDAHEIRKVPGAAGSVTSHSGLESLMFMQVDEKQLLQARRRGFSFNRLAPYQGLDHYLPELKARWARFCEVIKPVRALEVKMRFINRIELPMEDGQVDLDHYLKVGPRAPDEDAFGFSGFNSRSAMIEKATGARLVLSLASLRPSNNLLPIILDIEAAAECECDPADWDAISERLATLRLTKNLAFKKSLGEKCHALFN